MSPFLQLISKVRPRGERVAARLHRIMSTSAHSTSSLPELAPGHIRITEGSATMDYNKEEAVFYNKVQVFNRDISIQVIKLFCDIREREKQEKYEAKYKRYENMKEAGIKEGQKPVIQERSVYSRAVDGFLTEDAPELQEKEKVEVYTSPRGGPGSKTAAPPLRPPKGIAILDALAATGLRSVRYLKEIPNVRKLVINDIVPEATAQAHINCQNNDADMNKVIINSGDAIEYMYAHREPALRFDVVDLDPYGTAAPFLDSAVQAVADGGLICCTCTDMAVLSGNFPEKCFSLYGTVGLKAHFMHEASLRTLLHALDSAANKHKKHIVPWLSLSVDFYIRVFVRVYESPAEVKKSLTRRMMVFQSTQCESFYTQAMGQGHASKKTPENKPHLMYSGAQFEVPATCEETGGSLRMGGPYWGAPIHDQEIVDKLLARADEMGATLRGMGTVIGAETGEEEEEEEEELMRVQAIGSDKGAIAATSSARSNEMIPTTLPRIKALLGVISGELKDVPLYYNIPDLCANLHCVVPTSDKIRSAISNAGYRFSHFHHEPNALKTDAPPSVVWDILRAWCKLHPPAGSKHKKSRISSSKILENSSKIIVDWTPVKSAKRSRYVHHEDGSKEKAIMFPVNPDDNWGPKRKHGTAAAKEEAEAELKGSNKKLKN